MTVKKKKDKIKELFNNPELVSGSWLLDMFFDLNSNKMLDKKIEVLEKLKSGMTPGEIGDDYFLILEKMPKNTENTTIFW